jgi:cyclic lactone autoinducer peptide
MFFSSYLTPLFLFEMLNKLKTLAISCVAFVGILAALGGIQPTSIGALHQPELPRSCK